MKFKPKDRTLPPRWKFRIDADFHRAFTRMERVKILLGFNASIGVSIATEHHSGKFSPMMELALTAAIKPRPSFLSRLLNRKPK